MNLEPTFKIPEICWKHGEKKQPQRFISVKNSTTFYGITHWEQGTKDNNFVWRGPPVIKRISFATNVFILPLGE